MEKEQIQKMTELEKNGFLYQLTFKVTYDGNSHLTTYQGAFSLLNGRLEQAGVIRDAKAAALRAFEGKCLSEDWHFPFEAGVITIEKAEAL